MMKIFHHHLIPEIRTAMKTMMCHFANATCNKTNEKGEANYNKEPGYKCKEFSRHFFFEFCKQEGTGQYGQQGYG